MKITHWLILAIVVLALGNVILWNMLSGSEMSRQSAKSVFLEQEKTLQRELAIERAKVDAERHGRVKSDSLYRVSEKSRLIARNDLKRRERLLRPDTVVKTLVDTIYASYQTDIDSCKAKAFRDSSSFECEIASLNTINSDLDSANTAKFEKIDSLLSIPEPSTWQLGFTGGIGTTLSHGKLHAGPTINFGLTKTIKIKKIRLRDLFRKR
jgi:hypothetical protein